MNYLLQVIEDIKHSVERMALKENERYVTLMFDEMSIQEDLVRVIFYKIYCEMQVKPLCDWMYVSFF